MDDELAAMNASLDEAQNEFMDEEDMSEPHTKIQVDSDPEQKSQEITDASGKIDERDEVTLDPDSTSQVNSLEPSAKSGDDKQVKTNGSENSQVEDTSETNEDTSSKSDAQDTEEGTDPAQELQDKAGDQLQEGDESIFKDKKGLTKDDAKIDDAPETTEEDSRESVSKMITSVMLGAFMMITLA